MIGVVVDPARLLRLQPGRGLREAQRPAQAVGMIRPVPRPGPTSRLTPPAGAPSGPRTWCRSTSSSTEWRAEPGAALPQCARGRSCDRNRLRGPFVAAGIPAGRGHRPAGAARPGARRHAPRPLPRVRAIARGGRPALGTVREDEGDAVAFVLERRVRSHSTASSRSRSTSSRRMTAPSAPREGIEYRRARRARYADAFAVYSDGVADIPTGEPLCARGRSPTGLPRSSKTSPRRDRARRRQRRRLCQPRDPQRSAGGRSATD